MNSQAAAATSVPPAAPRQTTWEIDPVHSTAQFSVKHMMVSTVRGHFRKVSGTVQLDERDLTRSRVEVEIEASSVDTGEAKRDAHLRSADFFDAEKFPKIAFRSSRIDRAGEGFSLQGELTMHGQTRPVTLSVEPLAPVTKDPYGRVLRGTSATARLNRKEWGLGWNAVLETGGVLVGEEVRLQIDVELVARSPATP
ncbi:MAG TPA: YceI family protein [Myxococcaceae bacterium]|nr:YceI family protein [Myxococcaceae bacterium]